MSPWMFATSNVKVTNLSPGPNMNMIEDILTVQLVNALATLLSPYSSVT